MEREPTLKPPSMKTQNGLTLLLICWLTCFAACRAPEPVRNKAKAQRYVERIKALDPDALTYLNDTVFSEYIFSDTVYLRSILRDTLFQYLPGDTVFIQSEGTTARVIFLPGNQASLTLSRPTLPIVFTDTFSVATNIQTTQISEKPFWSWLNSSWQKINTAALIIGLLFIVLFVIRFTNKVVP